jgi:hypothetical protein
MAGNGDYDADVVDGRPVPGPANAALALALAALAAVGVALAIQQAMQRRLSKPEVTRLKFYRYLRERGRLES